MRKYLIAALILTSFSAFGRPSSSYSELPIVIQQWFQGLMQPDNPYMSCCGEADAFEADSYETEGDHYVAIITNGKGTMPDGTRVVVPNNKIKWDRGNPTGHGIIFIGSSGQVYCYITPASG